MCGVRDRDDGRGIREELPPPFLILRWKDPVVFGRQDPDRQMLQPRKPSLDLREGASRPLKIVQGMVRTGLRRPIEPMPLVSQFSEYRRS